MYFAVWNKDSMNRTSKLWPGWNATIEKTEVKGIKSIGKFKALQLFKLVANFSFTLLYTPLPKQGFLLLQHIVIPHHANEGVKYEIELREKKVIKTQDS